MMKRLLRTASTELMAARALSCDVNVTRAHTYIRVWRLEFLRFRKRALTSDVKVTREKNVSGSCLGIVGVRIEGSPRLWRRYHLFAVM